MSNKKIFKRTLSIILASCMLMGSIGCGGKGNSSSTVDNKNNDNNSNNDTVSKDYAYKANYIDVETKLEDFNNIKLVKDKIYAIGTNYEETDEKDEEGYNIYKTETFLYSSNIDGKNSKDITLNLSTNEYIYAFNVDKDENIITLIQKTEEIENQDYDSENYTPPKQTYIIKKFDTKGKELSSKEIDTSKLQEQSEYFYMNNAVVTDDESLYFCFENNILGYDADGKEILNIVADEDYIESMIVNNNGKIYYSAYNDGYVLKELDIEEEKVINEYKIPVPNSGNCQIIAGDENYDIYIKSTNGLYGYLLEKNEVIKLVDWLDIDIISDYVEHISILNEDEVICYLYDYTEQKREFIKLEKIPASEVKEKQNLTLAVEYAGSDIRRNVIDFNKTNEEYRIKLIDYSEYDDPSMQMNSDMVGGKIPDIVDVSSISIEQFISKGILTDLYPFIEKDKDISKDDFLDEIINVIEKDGKLYYMAPSFYMSVLAGNKKDIKGRKSWTIKDMAELLDSKPKGTQLMQYMSNTSLLYTICYNNLNQYINWDTGECKFDNQDFIDLLEFSNRFPNPDDIEYGLQDDMVTKIKNGNILLIDLYVSDLGQYQMYKAMIGKKNFETIGYPTNEGSGVYCTLNGGSLAITEQCKNKDAAWEFVKTYLTYKYQKKTMDYGLPTRKDVLEKKFEQAMATKEYVDEDGDTVRPQSGSYGYNDFEVEIKPATQEEVDEIRDMISRIDSCGSYSQSTRDITQIITEEASAYFSGQKSAKEAAEIIQSRVKIYVNENM